MKLNNVDLIIRTLEEKTGLEIQPLQYAPMVCEQTDYLGFNPWKDIDYGQRVPVYVYTDLKDEHYVSCANSNGVIFFCNELISQEVWDSVPTYKEESKAHFFVSYEVKNEITSQNAEDIFRNDYSDMDFADREDKYTYGRMLCTFLEENYGDGFLRD